MDLTYLRILHGICRAHYNLAVYGCTHLKRSAFLVEEAIMRAAWDLRQLEDCLQSMFFLTS